MIRHVMLILFLVPTTHVNAAGADWWKDCPGPACPARDAESLYKKADKEDKNYEQMNREEMRVERDKLESKVREIDKEVRRRDIDRQLFKLPGSGSDH